MKPPSHIDFDHLTNEAFIQVRQLVECRVLPWSSSTYWRKSREGSFPKPVKVSPGITAWRVGEIRAFLNSVGTKPTGSKS